METGAPELHPLPVVSTWHHIGIDFIGPLKYNSRQANRYILAISDYFGKFTQAFAKEVLLFVISALLRYIQYIDANN